VNKSLGPVAVSFEFLVICISPVLKRTTGFEAATFGLGR
jgi:hypothetical protein